MQRRPEVKRLRHSAFIQARLGTNSCGSCSGCHSLRLPQELSYSNLTRLINTGPSLQCVLRRPVRGTATVVAHTEGTVLVELWANWHIA